MDYKFKPVSYPLYPPSVASNKRSVMAFSFAKAGSTLLFNMLRQLAPDVGLTYYSPQDALFAANMGPNNRPTDIGDVFRPTGYCYAGFRSYPSYPIPILSDVPVILLVRDPRDMAVSLYYSLLLSHPLPENGQQGSAREEMLRTRNQMAQTSIDDFVMRSAITQYRRMFEGYAAQGFLWRPNVTIYRYEDVIFAKKEWLQAICRTYGWEAPAVRIEAVAAAFDERPETARPDKHVRSVTPGDHKTRLKPQTIEKFSRANREYLEWFGYA